ncbi:putative RNA polymerase II transcription factor B subunit 1 [Escovopsis weberi]|uniref:Putative RNA polymerase II transcription factor B subunit 1 n=1 Tax=Escovopsis weberi TaxID=150374 RepID=A0A0N0RT83_ESCWE|nr:putative RNA polymerase II transcription factor B subunit 1 [Escovopsis weberi]
MAIPTGRTLYKKKDGILTITGDHRTVTWTPNSGGPPTVSLPVTNITNLQQTPDTAAKVMLKIFEKVDGGGDPATYLFHFNTSEAKAEAQAVKDLLSRLLADLRSNDSGMLKPTADGTPGAAASPNGGNGSGSGSASMAFANAVNSQSSSVKWFDDASLKMNIELQQSLMKKDRGLHKTYVDAIATKPDSISGAAFNAQFWSTRIKLLRSHAIEINQKKGAYNVLSTIKPRTVEGELKLNISVEQVQMIFAQHPLVKRIYNENVPRTAENNFWARFFLSKLAKTLRGERVAENDPSDPIFDKYDANESLVGTQSRIVLQTVPHFIDIEANEENQGGFKSGNAKDVEMRPRANIPIVKTLNSVSEKIMANVAPSDVDENGQARHDKYSQLALRDLRGDTEGARIMLHVKEQSQFFSARDSAPSANAQIFAKQNPAEVYSRMRGFLADFEGDGSRDTGLQIGVDLDSDCSDSEGEPNRQRNTARDAIRTAEKGVMGGIRQQRAQKYGHASDSTTPMGLPAVLAEKCALTHATTIEFLHQFWNSFLSGDPDRATELQYLAESLSRSTERINAVAEEAEQEREETIRQRKQEIRNHFERTGKKIRWKSDMVGGGRDAVLKIMGPTLEALQKAQADYSRALAAEGIQISTEG